MSKLYVFGIGGTGSRVIRSLTMLLAAGVECNDTIVPIIIDRDLANADLTRTANLIEDYISVSKKAPRPSETNKNRFFSTPIELLDDHLFLKLEDNTQVFSEFIQQSTMNEANQALVNMLFAEKTLQLNMTEGFQGNPNIGSVVLNQFDEADIFKSFANNFQDGDKIFIISSIFGGTGASGFPLLLKNLNSSKPEMDNWGYVQNAPIGAISVMPYFNVSNKKSDRNKDSLVDSDTFIDKTKAALSYYQSLDNQLDTLYYIADRERTTYEHNKGGVGQENDAHFVELVSALSILDFASQTPKRKDNKRHTVYKEFGVEPGKQTDAGGNEIVSDCRNMNFSDLADTTNNIIREPMIQFFLFRKYMKEVFDKESNYQPYARNLFDKGFKESDVIKKVESIQDDYYKWLKEMGRQSRSFTPFKLDAYTKEPFEFITDLKETKKVRFPYKYWSWMDNELNKNQRGVEKVSKSLSKEAQFIELFYIVTKKFVNEIAKK